eukprot:1181006-Prymnesium_polylepis.1
MSNEGLRGALEGFTARFAAKSLPSRNAHGDRPSPCASQVAARGTSARQVRTFPMALHYRWPTASR